jgi:hypothetical protein
MIDKARILQSNKKNKERNSNEMPEEQQTNPKGSQQESKSRKKKFNKNIKCRKT